MNVSGLFLVEVPLESADFKVVVMVYSMTKVDQDMPQYHSSITISLNSDMDGGGELCREEGRATC